MIAVTRIQVSSMKLMFSIGLFFASSLATDQSEPQLFSDHNKSALPLATLKNHGRPNKLKSVDGNSDEEARVITEIFNGLGPIINKLRGEGTSSLTESLLQTNAKIVEGDKDLVKHLQAVAERTEAQDSQLLATIGTFREAENPSDQAFGDFEFIKMLDNPKLAEAVYKKWLDDEVSPSTAIELLDRSYTDDNPRNSLQNFFKHGPALPWLSYVGYCWAYEKNNFSEKMLYQLFKRANLNAAYMVELLYRARKRPFVEVVLQKMQRTTGPWTKVLRTYLKVMADRDTYSYANLLALVGQQLGKSSLNV